MLDSLVRNPHFSKLWLEGDSVMKLSYFAEDVNRFRLCEKKFGCFDRICGFLAKDINNFTAGTLDAIITVESRQLA